MRLWWKESSLLSSSSPCSIAWSYVWITCPVYQASTDSCFPSTERYSSLCFYCLLLDKSNWHWKSHTYEKPLRRERHDFFKMSILYFTLLFRLSALSPPFGMYITTGGLNRSDYWLTSWLLGIRWYTAERQERSVLKYWKENKGNWEWRTGSK